MVLYLDFGLIIDLVSKGEDPCMNVVDTRIHQSMIDPEVIKSQIRFLISIDFIQ